MPTDDSLQEFIERAHESRLEISINDATEIGEFGSIVAAAYTSIREIDTTGFEPAAIFIPVRSQRQLAQRESE